MSTFDRSNLKAGFDAPGAIETNASELVSAADVVVQLDNIADSCANRLDDPYFKILGATGGTSSALTLTSSNDYSGTAYDANMGFIFQMNQDSGASPTININSIGALPIYDDLQNQITAAGDLVNGRYYAAIFNPDADGSGTDGIVIILRFGSTSVETGVRTDSTTYTISSPGTYVFDGTTAATWTLPAGSALIQWSKFYIANVGTANISLGGDGSDPISGTDPFIIYPDTGLKTIVWDGEIWILSN